VNFLRGACPGFLVELINLNALESAESIGGGRLRARFRGDVLVETSRAGAKLLRDRSG